MKMKYIYIYIYIYIYKNIYLLQIQTYYVKRCVEL